MHGTRELPLPDGSRMAYFDSGGRGLPLVCLHGHFGRGHLWGPVAAALAPGRRIIAPDLPGHGRSSPAGDDWLVDAVARVGGLIERLGLREPALLGHSTGGIVAYTLAARRPRLIRALISVEAAAVVSAVPDPGAWDGVPARFESFAALRAAVDSPWHWESAAEFDDGWGFRFDAAALLRARAGLIGDHWLDWRGSRIPGLVVRGADSPRLGHAHAREMAARRPRTRLVELPGCGHVPQDDDPAAFAAAVRAFLDGLA
jgi:pimeloyl-ACP methyl ester carboxylesterase